MLRELHIQNLAVIQDITVELCPGLNCFTGQTGAGKSLVIGALEILLGLRQPSDMLRKGAAEGRVSGVFHLDSQNLREEIAGATDLPLEDEPELIIARRIFESGRTSASLNGNPITGAMLKQVGEILVDVHGQHDAQYLLKPANQLAVIDEFGSGILGAGAGADARKGGGCVELRREFSELFHRRQGLLAQQRDLAASRTLRRQQLELYEFQAKEIDEAQLVAGEHAELSARGKLLANLEKIKRTAGLAYGTLYEEEASIIERLRATMVVLLELAELDESLEPIANQIKETAVNLDDAAFSLRRYIDRLDLDPAELAQVSERLNLVNRMINKYAGRGAVSDGLDEVIAYRTQIGRQIEELRSQDVDFSTIGDEISGLEKQLKKVGAELSDKRRKAADKLIPLVHRQLADLGMKEARFLIEFQPLQMGLEETTKPKTQNAKQEARNAKRTGIESLAGVLGGGEELKLGAQDFALSSGMETVEFLIAPNPGQPARPLRRIASGGELSRIMLALKGILAQKDRVSVLVFDEIDANVGGRMGSIIGEKLRALAAIHQVLCITHLPQIAAFADRHLTIRKQISDSKGAKDAETRTSVSVMEGEARVQELAEMTAGSATTQTALAQARELLAAASGSKPKAPASKTRRAT